MASTPREAQCEPLGEHKEALLGRPYTRYYFSHPLDTKLQIFILPTFLYPALH
jgi:hypothetical protein